MAVLSRHRSCRGQLVEAEAKMAERLPVSEPPRLLPVSEARKSLTAWLARRRGAIHDFLFPSRVDYLGHLSTRQYARLVDEWVATVGLDQREYGTHSLRRAKASLIYKGTGNLRAVQILLGHTNIENTVRYLSVDIDDALTLSERTEI
ncbi:tyrosine-type recombinase/integrase [Altererythrobacter soli]|uniref:Tyrosine-type recombinase/integrase n=1 Tax=Croceibacterium soli TaxID=1739690 RepID=A0A6I4USE7_9SPHN|nr:tyrosine-type recombinase/integrase [Croceibacterium soli]